VIGWTFGAAFDVVDPCRLESFGEGAVGRQQVDSHSQVA
jgi:hypothetical protein